MKINLITMYSDIFIKTSTRVFKKNYDKVNKFIKYSAEKFGKSVHDLKGDTHTGLKRVFYYSILIFQMILRREFSMGHTL